jgi:excisionase family DNA binding protein
VIDRATLPPPKSFYAVNEQQNALTEREAARYVGVSPATLRLWRSQGQGPRHFKAGEKLVRYRRVDLDAWIEDRLSVNLF